MSRPHWLNGLRLDLFVLKLFSCTESGNINSFSACLPASHCSKASAGSRHLQSKIQALQGGVQAPHGLTHPCCHCTWCFGHRSLPKFLRPCLSVPLCIRVLCFLAWSNLSKSACPRVSNLRCHPFLRVDALSPPLWLVSGSFRHPSNRAFAPLHFSFLCACLSSSLVSVRL